MGGDDPITGNGNTQRVVPERDGSGDGRPMAGTATGDASVGTDTFTGVVRCPRLGVRRHADGQQQPRQSSSSSAARGDDFINGRGGFDRANYSSFVDDTVTGGVTINMAVGHRDRRRLGRHRHVALDRVHPRQRISPTPTMRPDFGAAGLNRRQQFGTTALQRIRGDGRQRHHHRQRQHPHRVLQRHRRA